jgi:DME family drug/metabolite transporter
VHPSGLLTGRGSADPLGIHASVGAGASYAVYAVVAARLIARGVSRARTMGHIFGTAALISLPWWLTTDRAWLLTWRGAAGALWLGIAATAVAYLLFARGLGVLPTPTVATLTLAEPLTATLLGLIVLDERLALSAWVGIAILGVALVALAVQRQPRTDLVGQSVNGELG